MVRRRLLLRCPASAQLLTSALAVRDWLACFVMHGMYFTNNPCLTAPV